MDNRKIIKEQDVTDNLQIVTLISYNEENIYLKVDYLKGKFTIEKRFRNNYIGLEEYEEQVNNLNTEEKVKKYFGI